MASAAAWVASIDQPYVQRPGKPASRRHIGVGVGVVLCHVSVLSDTMSITAVDLGSPHWLTRLALTRLGRTSADASLTTPAGGADHRRTGSNCSTSPPCRSPDTGTAAPRSQPWRPPTTSDGRQRGDPVAENRHGGFGARPGATAWNEPGTAPRPTQPDLALLVVLVGRSMRARACGRRCQIPGFMLVQLRGAGRSPYRLGGSVSGRTSASSHSRSTSRRIL